MHFRPYWAVPIPKYRLYYADFVLLFCCVVVVVVCRVHEFLVVSRVNLVCRGVLVVSRVHTMMVYKLK